MAWRVAAVPYGFDMSVPPEALPHRVSVEKNTPTTVDAEGAPIAAESTVYADLPALVAPMSAMDVADFQARGLDVNHRVFVGPLPDGTMPVVTKRHRLVFGTRRFEVKGRTDEAELNVLLEILALERAP